MLNCCNRPVGLASVALFASVLTAQAQGFDYQFNVEGVLPSAQLATFGGNVPEDSVFWVSAGYLHQNTVSAAAAADAYYEFNGLFDHTIDATLEFRARLSQCAPAQPSPCAGGAAILVRDAGYAWNFNLTPDGLWIPASPFSGAYVPLVSAGTPALPTYTPFNEHTYTVTIPANTSQYTLKIDGVHVASGQAYPSPGASYVWFGDGTPSGGNASVDWNFITLRNTNVSYNVCALYDETRAVRAGATYPIKIQLCDAAGNNVSSASISVKALSTTHVSTNVSGAVVDSGNANPDANFRYDATLAGYMFNLSTAGLDSGTYSVNFNAGEDPSTHSVQFQVK